MLEFALFLLLLFILLPFFIAQEVHIVVHKLLNIGQQKGNDNNLSSCTRKYPMLISGGDSNTTAAKTNAQPLTAPHRAPSLSPFQPPDGRSIALDLLIVGGMM